MNDEERTEFQRLRWSYEGEDGKGGLKYEFQKVQKQVDEIYTVFRVLKWAVLWLIGPAGTLYIASQVLELARR